MYKTILHWTDPYIKEFQNNVIKTEKNDTYLYWFSDDKMRKANFYNIETFLTDNKVISFSGCSIYDEDTLRVGQTWYTLKDYRIKYRSLMDVDGEGFLARHLETAKKLNCKKMIMTFHVHNRRTEVLFKQFKNNKYYDLGTKSSHWRNKFVYKGPQIIKFVEQEVFEVEV
jgi:hypothetical protein